VAGGALFALGACGGRGVSGDTARFDVGGTSISVTMRGSGTIHVDRVPPLDYSGPLGCRGRYFTTEYPGAVPLDFRYSGHDAYLLALGRLYHLIGGPVRSGGELHWSESIGDTKIGVTVDCPLPPGSLPPVSAAAPPDACQLLTRALATQTLGRGIGRAQRLKLGWFDTTCIYQTKELNSVSLHIEDAATLESETLWRAPAVSGLGVPAHAAPAPDGLVAVKSNVGIEVTVGLGGSQAANTAAEIRVARKVLAKLGR
jgi:hypothetical protein